MGIDIDDPLILAARSYENLIDKDFIITLDTKDGNKESIHIQFQKDNFFHLIGFHKLKDLPQLDTSKNKKTSIFNKVLKGIISYEDIKKSVHFDSNIENRINYFHNIEKLLFEKVIIDFDKNRLDFPCKLYNCDYIFLKNKNGTYMHLTIGKKFEHYPESFFVEFDDKYIKDQDVFKILSIEEISQDRKKKGKSKRSKLKNASTM